MTSTGFESQWQWPQDLPGGWIKDEDSSVPAAMPKEEAGPSSVPRHPPPPPPPADEHSNEQRERFYPPRTCRICLETVLPTFHPPSESLPGFLQSSSPSVTYESEDGGRLLRPCLCKGTQKYVHEGCLTAWRLQNPMEKRNYWQCPTCKYNYRLERMTWGRLISSTASQVALTLAIFVVATFLLGFFADPILNLYVDPYGTLEDLADHGTHAMYEDEPVTWTEHFIKGMASLGLLGFAKFLLTLSPFHGWNMRGTGMMGGGRAATGRDRVQQISWYVLIVGCITVLVAVWKGVRVWSRKTLENFSERVMDVPGDDHDDEDE
ncbi:hypothetical protein BDV97DRAFT_369049 [Delphinella strobiligena]|nr:hypothetical protein BDV97DRAFT_369049 [Delphinella strobiligena]